MSSPSYPNNYPENEDCNYTISVSNGTVIMLNFLTMDVQRCTLGPYVCMGDPCANDYLEIRDGPSDDSPLLGKLCGSEIPDIIYSGQNHLWIT